MKTGGKNLRQWTAYSTVLLLLKNVVVTPQECRLVAGVKFSLLYNLEFLRKLFRSLERNLIHLTQQECKLEKVTVETFRCSSI